MIIKAGQIVYSHFSHLLELQPILHGFLHFSQNISNISSPLAARPVFVGPVYYVCLKNGEMRLFRQCF